MGTFGDMLIYDMHILLFFFFPTDCWRLLSILSWVNQPSLCCARDHPFLIGLSRSGDAGRWKTIKCNNYTACLNFKATPCNFCSANSRLCSHKWWFILLGFSSFHVHKTKPVSSLARLCLTYWTVTWPVSASSSWSPAPWPLKCCCCNKHTKLL